MRIPFLIARYYIYQWNGVAVFFQNELCRLKLFVRLGVVVQGKVMTGINNVMGKRVVDLLKQAVFQKQFLQQRFFVFIKEKNVSFTPKHKRTIR